MIDVAATLNRLPASVEHLLAATAVLGGRASLATVSVVADSTDPRLDVERAEAEGLARLEREAAESLVLVEGLTPVLLERLSTQRARQFHQAAARVLDDDAALDHLLAASSGPDRALADALERLALRERAAGHLEAAGRHLTGAAGATSAAGHASRLAVDACEAFVAAGSFARAEALTPLVQQATDPRRDLLLGTIDLDAGRAGAARARLEPLALKVDAGLMGALAACVLGVLDNLDGRADAAMRWADLANELAEGVPDVVEAARASLGFIHAVSGRTDDALSVCGGLPEDRATTPRLLLERLLVRGVAHYWAGDWDRGDADTAAVAARGDATHRQRSLALACLAGSAFRTGRWDHSVDLAEQALSAADRGGVRQNLALLHSCAALVPAARGNSATARSHIDQARARARLTDLRLDRVYAIHAEIVLAHAQDRPEHILAAVERERDLLDADGLATHGVLPWRELYAEALLRLGRAAEATEVLAVVDRDARVRLAPQAEAVRGRLKAADGDLAGAVCVLDAGLRRAITERLPLDAALVESAWADVVAERDPRASTQRRRSASARFEQLGATPYSERCAAAGAPPGVRRDAGAGVLDRLTRAERDVLGRVGEGLSNRQIAAALVVSERTVEFHLGNVYRKLGVRSRTGAASVLHGPALGTRVSSSPQEPRRTPRNTGDFPGVRGCAPWQAGGSAHTGRAPSPLQEPSMHIRTRLGAGTLSVLATALAVLTPLMVPAQASIFWDSVKWPADARGYTIVPVCIVQGSSAERRNDDGKNPSLEAVIGQVRGALSNSWESVTNVRFVGWRDCEDLTADQQEQTVGLFIRYTADNSSPLGTTAIGVKAVRNLNVSFKPWGLRGKCAKPYRFSCVRQYARHEFGHALGFIHEWRHPLTPKACKDSKPRKYEQPLDSNKISEDPNDDSASYTSQNLKNYDWDSLMTYDKVCADVTGERFGSATLSPSDKANARVIYPPLTPGTNDVGVIPAAKSSCPDGKLVSIHLDNEDKGNGNRSAGWYGATEQDHNTTFNVCRVDGDQFGSLPRASTGTAHYATLLLGKSCPEGAWEFIRYHDDEEEPPLNESWIAGEFGKNRQNFKAKQTGTELHYCFFKQQPDTFTITEMPRLGYRYGVWAAPTFEHAKNQNTGSVRTDDDNRDELRANSNKLTNSSHGKLSSKKRRLVKSLMVVGKNTKYLLAQVR